MEAGVFNPPVPIGRSLLCSLLHVLDRSNVIHCEGKLNSCARLLAQGLTVLHIPALITAPAVHFAHRCCGSGHDAWLCQVCFQAFLCLELGVVVGKHRMQVGPGTSSREDRL